MITKNQKQKNLGFTLIEMIVVMGMIGIVSMAVLKLVRFSDINKNLTLATSELKGMVRTAQVLALAPPVKTNNNEHILHICGFVVRNGGDIIDNDLEVAMVFPKNNDVELCKGLSGINQICDNGTNTTCERYKIKHFDGFTIREATDDVKVFFKTPYGEVFGAGDITIKQNGNSEIGKTIRINKQGKINVVD